MLITTTLERWAGRLLQIQIQHELYIAKIKQAAAAETVLIKRYFSEKCLLLLLLLLLLFMCVCVPWSGRGGPSWFSPFAIVPEDDTQKTKLARQVCFSDEPSARLFEGSVSSSHLISSLINLCV